MLSAFKAKFGDKWNDDWDLSELGDFCDEFIENSGGSALARYMDYGALMRALHDDGYTIWKFVETETGHSFTGEDAHDFDDNTVAWVGHRWNGQGELEYYCETDGLWVITNADTDLLEEAEAESEAE